MALLLTTAVNQRLAEREAAAEQQRIHEAKKSLAHQLQASTLPGGTGTGDLLQVFRRHDKEGKEGLSLEQFSTAIRRDGKLGRSKMSEKEVSQLFASLDTEKQGVVKLEKLSSLAGGARKPLGEVTGNGTPTPRDRQRRGKPAGKKAARSSTRAKLSNPSATIDILQDTAGNANAEAMLAAAEATVIAREQHPDETTLSLLPSRRSISCIPRKPRPPGTTSAEAAPPTESVQGHAVEENDTPPVSPVDESPCKDLPAASESPTAQDTPIPVVTGTEWSAAEHSRFEEALEMQGIKNSPPAEAWAAISAQVGDERTVEDVKAYGMRYLAQLSQVSEQGDSDTAPSPCHESHGDEPAHTPQQTADAVDTGHTSGSGWSQDERGRLAAALDILGPALLSPGALQSGQASRVWEALANAVGGGRTAWETRCVHAVVPGSAATAFNICLRLTLHSCCAGCLPRNG